MAGMQEPSAAGWNEAIDARLAASEARIQALQDQAATAGARADDGELRAADDRKRIGALESRVDVDAVLIADLQAEGLVGKEQTANLTLALRTSRTIGAAVGIIMATRRLTEEAAFELLRKASMDTNQKLRDLADDVVRTGELTSPAP